MDLKRNIILSNGRLSAKVNIKEVWALKILEK